MRLLFICFILCAVLYVDGATRNIEKIIKKYFEHDNQMLFSQQWKKYQRSIEHALEQVLSETFSESGLNVYVRKTENSHKLSEGYLASDNIVKVLFKDLYLTQIPRLRAAEVSFDLSSNVLRVDADVSKMFLDAEYLLLRNLSDVGTSTGPFDPYNSSPFTLQQVKNMGEVTIIVEGCVLSGIAIVTFLGQTLHLGQDIFRLMNCKLSVEITSPGTGSPPVIAPYFTRTQANELEQLLLKPIREELLPKLQGALVSYVNTSSMFGAKLPMFRQRQHFAFKKTSDFMTRVVSQLNKLIAKKNGGVEHLEDEAISWTDKYKVGLQDTKVTISNVTVSGLDSIYSSHTGGPFQMREIAIIDALRIGTLQVIGNINLEVKQTGVVKSQYAFYGEIQDASVYLSIGIHMATRALKKKEYRAPLKLSKTVLKCVFDGWRNIDIHSPDLPNECEICLHAPRALITGYLLNTFPSKMVQIISQHFDNAVSRAEKRVQNHGDDKNDDANNEKGDIDELKETDQVSDNNQGDEKDQLNTDKSVEPDVSNKESDGVKVEDNEKDATDGNENSGAADEAENVQNHSNEKQSGNENTDKRRAGEIVNFHTKIPSQYLSDHLFDNEIHSD